MVKVKNITGFLEKELKEKILLKGCGDVMIKGFSSLGNYRPGTMTWCKNLENLKKFTNSDSRYALVIAPYIDETVIDRCDAVIMTENPKKTFFAAVEHFFYDERQLPKIGQGTYISPDVKIGRDVRIGYNCVLDGNIVIGEGTVIYNNVIMINKVKVGSNCIIHSGTVIGHDDFSYTEDQYHNKTMIKHYGGVDIGKNVFIGANSVINRGTIDDTVINEGCKIDAFCHISHNVRLGEKSSLISGTRLYGSVKTGGNVYIASAIVKNQLTIEENAVIGMGSVVLTDTDKNAVVAGIPAKPLRK